MQHPERFGLAGVMGHPVLHSRSPMIHNRWFADFGIAGTYVPLAVEPAGLQAALRALAPLGFAGCNVTIPHKEAALPLLDEVDPLARRIGAANCVIVRPDGSLLGRNYDAFGFLESIRERVPNVDFTSGPAVVLGAGGAARAILAGLADQGCPDIRVVNRTLGRAEAIASEFGKPLSAHDWADRNRLLEGASLLVNTTSQGMTGQPTLDIDLARLPLRAVVCDIVYVPLQTPLLAAARARGNVGVDGLGMLLHQARPAFRDWFGVMPSVTEDLRNAIEATL
jgi:shikimate dehydrogenase